jgi:hypothetical protein
MVISSRESHVSVRAQQVVSFTRVMFEEEGVTAARLKEEGNNRKEEFIERGKKRGRRKTGETIERREEMDGWMWRNGGMDG